MIVRMDTLHSLHTAGGGAAREPQGRVEISARVNTTSSLTEEPDVVFHSYMASCQRRGAAKKGSADIAGSGAIPMASSFSRHSPLVVDESSYSIFYLPDAWYSTIVSFQYT